MTQDYINEFNRCFYDRPVDADKYTVMKNFNELKVNEAAQAQCNGLQECKVKLD